jgi:hypothetical protein
MGFSHSWIGVRGRQRIGVFTDLGLQDTGKVIGDAPFDDKFSWAETDSGWLIICSNDFEFANDSRLAKASAGGEAVGVFLEEHVIVSGARGYTDGRSVWAVVHESERNPNHLEVHGAPPDPFREIRDQHLAKQSVEDALPQSERATGLGVDYLFDIPLALALALTGYRLDGGVFNPDAPKEEWVPIPMPVFTKLNPLPTGDLAAKPSVLHRLIAALFK